MIGGSPEKPKAKSIEEVLPSADLLAHYRSRIDQFEQEREELLRAVERCAVHQDDVHRLEWENRKRADEIQELQKALSDAQQFLFEERQRLLLLQAENDELKLQELQDRQCIQQLLALAQPLEQTITLKHDALPSSVTAYPKPYVRSGGQQQRAESSKAAGAGKAGHAAAAGAGAGAAASKGERVLRTVFLPTVDPDSLLLKIESLQAQLNEQRQLHEERVAALLSDRQLRSQEEERQRSNLIVQVESLSKQVQQLEETLRTTTRDYILARREKQDAQAAAAAASAQMVSEVSAARSELAAARRATKGDVDRAAASADAKMRDYVDKFREQVRSREDELMNLASLHTATKAAADKRIADLEGRVGKLLEANRQLELRRQLDIDGWAADVTALRKTLAVVDRKLLQMKLIERLEDDERLDALLDHLEKRIPGPKQQHPAAAAVAAARPASTGRLQHQRARDPPVKRRLSSTVGRSSAAAGRLQRPAAVAAGGRRDQGGGGRGAAAAAAGLRPASAHSADSAAAQAEMLRRQGLGSGDADDDDDAAGDADTSGSSSVTGGSSSVKSGLAAELREVRQQLQDLELRAAGKARRAMAPLQL